MGERGKVIVTGASGFIGLHCLPLLLARGFEVVATTSRRGPGPLRGVVWEQVDLLKPDEVTAFVARQEATHLLHAAWRPVHGNVMSAPDNLDWVAASLNLVESFVAAGGHRVAVIGSCAEYDWSGGLCRAGVTPLAPASLYGACKNALRVALEEISSRTALNVVWPRIFFVYGANEHPSRLSAYVINALLDGRIAETTDGWQIRDYLHVRDAAEGAVAALASDFVGAVDLASGAPHRVRDIIIEIASQIGRLDLLRLGARGSSTTGSPIVLGDPAPANDAIDWHPRFDLRAGVAESIAAARASRPLFRLAM